MPEALFILDDPIRERVYPAPVYETIAEMVHIYAPPQTPAVVRNNPAILHDMELLFSSWTCPRIDADFLAAAPNLKAVFYGAGSIKSLATPEFWQAGIRITHAADANAITVAQFTLGQIILALKGVWPQAGRVRTDRKFSVRDYYPGLYRSRIGVIGLGMIGRHVCELLQALDVKILAYDPYADDETTRSLNVRLVDLDTLFREAQVVSLHAPWLAETEGMITGRHLASMLPHSTFINTARGALVREDEMITVLRERPDLYALLDVTYPEPPVPDSPLYTLPNVILTPHIAGAIDAGDTRRMGEMMVDELGRYLKGEALHWEIHENQLKTMA